MKKAKHSKMMEAHKLCKADLVQFTGTENWYRHPSVPFVLCTDGAKYIADQGGAYWLLDEIALAQLYEKKVSCEEYQFWKLTVKKDKTAILVCEVDDERVVFSKRFPHTDFPLDEISLFFITNTIMLVSEY